MANGLLSAELAATCNALGYYDGKHYHLEPHSKETIKDVIRYLRRDEDSHDIRRFLGNTKLLQTDLLPILESHAKDKELFDIVLRLVVNLTTPALIIYNEIVPSDKSDLNQYLQIISHLQSYKEAFSDQKTWAVFTDYLSALLNKDLDNRNDDDQRNIERILILVRNVLHVPANASSDWRPDNDASLHDQVIWALHQSGMLDLLLYMASSSQESNFFMHLLEIICLLVREQPATLLAETASQRSNDEKHRDEEELLKIRQKELIMKQSKTRQLVGTRHSNFGGTFIVKNLKSTSDKDLIYHKPLHKVNNFTLDSEKKPKKIPKNRMPLKCENAERKSALSVRLIMKQFCVEVLNAAYNPLMRHVKDCLVRGKTQSNDESYYFTALKFFMEFNRKYKFQVKLVSETMSVEAFYFVQKYLETWHEMMITDKKRILFWSTRMHIALKAYKELLLNLSAMDSSSEEAVRESSKVIKSNVFYVIEYREMLLVLVNTYRKSKYSHQYLIDLLETIHIFLRLLTKFCQNRKIIVQKQLTIRKKKRKPNHQKKQEESLGNNELWLLLKSDLEKALSSPVTKEVIPFDAASEKPFEEQKVDAMKRIQLYLKSGDCEEAIALLKASRDVWPENDCFGKQDMSQDEEMDCLKEVFLADLDFSDIKPKETNDEIELSEDEEEESYNNIAEQSFDVQDLVKRFASPKVTSICITLLSTFEKNSEFTNHCIAKMLHRIAWECKLPAMLFQASLFRKFQRIMESMDPSHKELVRLAKYILLKFVEVGANNKKLLLELLFFKTAKEAYEIECGYGSFQEKSKAAKLVWEEHEEDELRRLHEEYVKTKPSGNLLDWIMDNIINKNRSKRSIKKKLKELDLLDEGNKSTWEEHEEEELRRVYDEYVSEQHTENIFSWIISRLNKDRSKRQVKKKMSELNLNYSLNENEKDWTLEQEEELRNIFIESKDLEDPIGSIINNLKAKRSRRNVAATLVRLGLVDNTSVLRKKRNKNVNKKQMKEDSESDYSSDSDEETVGIEETREEIRAKELVPELNETFAAIFKQKNIDTYLVEGLQWIKSCMEECLEDVDDDPTEVPLLPLSREAILSLENIEFQQFLLSLGIFKPLQQEIYWRFPSNWKAADFTTRMALINLIGDMRSFEECLEEADVLINEMACSHSNNKENLENPHGPIAFFINGNRKNINNQQSENTTALEKRNKIHGSRRKARIMSESESDDEAQHEVEYEASPVPEKQQLVVSESQNESLFDELLGKSSKSTSLNEITSDTDPHNDKVSDDPVPHKRMRLLESDSEEETFCPEKRKRCVVLSDDDE